MNKNVVFKPRAGVYTVEWPDYQVFMRLDRLSESRGAVSAEIRIATTLPGTDSMLHHTRFNLLSTKAQEDVSKHLDNKVNTCDWSGMIALASYLTLEAYRRGEPLELLSTDQVVERPKYLVWPILPENHPTIIFGDGGVGKSQFALLLVVCLTTAWTDNKLNITVPETQVPVLYLDWETDKANILWNLKRLQTGLGRPLCNLHYRRCSRPLADDLPEIQHWIGETGARLLIIDSIGPAVSTDLNAAESATQLLGKDVRSLNITTLCLAHTSKSEQGNKTVFGSTFFKNLARSVWELKKSQEVGEQRINVGLYHRKANMSELLKPLGFEFSFIADEAIMVVKQQLKDLPELAAAVPLRDQIAAVLSSGAMSIKAIAEELETTEGNVRNQLNRHKEKLYIKLGSDKWGLKAYEN